MSDSDQERTKPLNASLGFLVNGLARIMRIALEERLREVELTPTSWAALMALSDRDQVSQTMLGREIYLDAATTTRTIDFLTARELVERQKDDNDRRVQIIGITELGSRVAAETSHIGDMVNADFTACLTPEERALVESLMRRMLDCQNEKSGDNNNDK